MSHKWVCEGRARQECKPWKPGYPAILTAITHIDEKEAAQRMNDLIEYQIERMMKLR